MSFIRRFAAGVGLMTAMLAVASVFGGGVGVSTAEATNSVTLCHRTGNSGFITISVSPSAVLAHLFHGDSLGACSSQSTPTPTPTATATPSVTPTATPSVTPQPTVVVTGDVVDVPEDPCAGVVGVDQHLFPRPAGWYDRPIQLRDPDCGQWYDPTPTPTVMPTPTIETVEVSSLGTWVGTMGPAGFERTVVVRALPIAGDGEATDEATDEVREPRNGLSGYSLWAVTALVFVVTYVTLSQFFYHIDRLLHPKS